MPTISAKVSARELEAITEYANACGETMSNLIRKVVIGESIFINLMHDVPEYEHQIRISPFVRGKEETQTAQETYNRIRKILGLNRIEI